MATWKPVETVHPLPIDKGRKEGEGMVGGSKREKKGRTVGGGIPNVGTERLVILADFSGLTGEKNRGGKEALVWRNGR